MALRTGTNVSVKGIAFLFVGVAIGFVTAALVYSVEQTRSRDADSLADDIQRRLDSLATESVLS